MRKILLLPLLMLISIVLIGCNDIYEGEPTDVDVMLMDEVISEGSIEAYLVIPIELASKDELTEIAYSSASLIYEKHFNTIGQDHVVLVLYFYSSEEVYGNDQNDLGYLTYDIDLNEDNFGLKLQENSLIFAK